MPFLDENGLSKLWTNIVARLNTKVEKSNLDELDAKLDGYDANVLPMLRRHLVSLPSL